MDDHIRMDRCQHAPDIISLGDIDVRMTQRINRMFLLQCQPQTLAESSSSAGDRDFQASFLASNIAELDLPAKIGRAIYNQLRGERY